MFFKKMFNFLLNKENSENHKIIIEKIGGAQILINKNLVNLSGRFVNGLVMDKLAVIIVDRESSGSNIYAYDENGLFVWRVQRHTFETELPGYDVLSIYEGHLQAYSRDTTFLIDPKDGTLIAQDSDRGGTITFKNDQT